MSISTIITICGAIAAAAGAIYKYLINGGL